MRQIGFRLAAIAVALLLVGANAVAAVAATRTLHGSVIDRERMALPPDARVEVQLLDVSLADAPSRTIARTSFRPRGPVPIPYRLRFDEARLKPRHSYGLRATISVGDRLWFTSTSRHSVEIGGPDRIDIPVQRLGGQAAPRPAGSPAGRWLAEDIRRGGVIDYLQTVLEIGPNGRVSGTGGCNRMSGQAKIAGDTIRFGAIASTRMACTPAAMNQERKFIAALEDVRRWRVDPARGKLILLDGRGNSIVVLSRL
ncbi:YbaY family lipoprotein [Kaistia granuli]|uniref:YbaY family lipoprotein n=1 Tax=Kaistia granuli TaxID=363259 RepID=UPI0003641312|nr:YbaY family lipoprotein [Kaistia granuli]